MRSSRYAIRPDRIKKGRGTDIGLCGTAMSQRGILMANYASSHRV
jgi:hypothetical protein